MKINKHKKYIVRSYDAGVFYGNIKEQNANEVSMTNARCLWYWEGAASLNQLAQEGVKVPNKCQFTMLVEEVILLGVCEILPCTPEAVANIDAVPVWKR